MQILNVQQGGAEWLSIRHRHFTASECSAMLGLSKYQTRNALLQQKATGITPDIDAGTQARFDQGHVAEAAARPLAEAIIGQDLYPITATLEVEGLPLLASFDGVSMDEGTIFEHKLFNKALANSIEDAKTGWTNGDPDYSHYIDPHYRFQMDQQLLVSGAKRCLFMTSDGTEENMSWCWYEPNEFAVDEIVAGWAQFAKDLAAYVPREITERPTAEVVIDLPALFVHAKGEITEHNMEAFGLALSTRLAEVRAIALVTDQDFSNAKGAAKKFRETAKAIGLSKEAMLSQTETIGEAARKMDAWAKDLNATALQLEKDVEREDMAKKTAMVNEAKAAISGHVDALHAEIKPITLNLKAPNFAEALKGKRSYASMQDAIDTALSQAKSEADTVARDVRGKLAWFRENALSHNFLFHDLQAIIYKAEDDFKLLVETRIKVHKQTEAEKLEAERQRIQAEEQAKVEAKVKAEQEAKAKEEADEIARQLSESHAKQHSESLGKAIIDAEKPAAVVLAKLAEVPGIAKPTRPSDDKLIKVIAFEFGVEIETATGWLMDFGKQQEAA